MIFRLLDRLRDDLARAPDNDIWFTIDRIGIQANLSRRPTEMEALRHLKTAIGGYLQDRREAREDTRPAMLAIRALETAAKIGTMGENDLPQG
jgi:hypothetical protein